MDHACVASMSATESNVKVCPLMDNESLEIFWTITSPSSSLSLCGGRIRTITWKNCDKILKQSVKIIMLVQLLRKYSK